MLSSDPTLNKYLQDIFDAKVCIATKYLEEDHALFTMKWFAYRVITPLAATKRFADDYRVARRRALHEHRDRHLAAAAKILPEIDWTKSNRLLTQLWTARQHADRLGMPYPEYLQFAFDFAMRRKREYLPLPNQLRPSTPAQIQAWNAELGKFWTVDLKAITFKRMPIVPSCSIGNGLATYPLTAFRQQLVEMANEQTNPPDFFATQIVKNRYLSEQMCADHVDANILAERMVEVDRDITYYGQDRASTDKLVARDSLPGCFAMIPATAPASCLACPAKNLCTERALALSDSVKHHYGAVDPVDEVRRGRGAAATRRCRAKAKFATLQHVA